MSMTRQTILASRPAAMVLALSLVAGLSVPFLVLPPVHAAFVVPNGTTELSPAPVNQVTAVAPNIAVTFDDSGSMNWTRMGDAPPWTTQPNGNFYYPNMDWGRNGNLNLNTNGGPWRCANVIDANDLVPAQAIRDMPMNGVYYNPNIIYTPPIYANGTSFQNADATLAAVWVDGMAVNRPLNPASSTGTIAYNNNPDLDYPGESSRTNLTGQLASLTTYATFGTTSDCPANIVSGSCTQHTSNTVAGNHVFYVLNVDSTTGSGISTVYSGANLQTSSTSVAGYTKVTGNGNNNTKYYVTWQQQPDQRWQCGTGSGSNQGQSAFWNGASPMDGQAHTLSDGTTITYPNGGPYYYRLKQTVTIAPDSFGNPTNTGCTTTDCDGLHTLYDPASWEAVPITNTNVTINGVTVNQYQNFANWYAYYRTRNQMARSAMSRVFGSAALSALNADGGFGNDIRVTWQNLNSGTYDLPSAAIISALIDTSACSASASASASPSGIQQSGAVQTAPNCYRSAFFNWIFQVPASGGTPTQRALNRAGQFFTRGNGNTGSNGNLEDPYWQPPPHGAFDASTNPGNELYCRQNFQMLVTDGLWNTNVAPLTSSLTQPTTTLTLPDGVAFPTTAAGVGSIYAPESDGGYSGRASLSDIAFSYWAQDLRPDLYVPNPPPPGTPQIVPAYLPDTTTGLFAAGNVVGGNGNAQNIPAEEYFNPKNDPATWPHMVSYMVGLGVNGELNFSENTDCTGTAGADMDACNLRKGIANSTGFVGWPQPNGVSPGIAANIDDTWHAALASRGQFFSAGNPQQLVDQLTGVLLNIAARASQPTPAAVNASVATVGALAFETSYNKDWSGNFTANAVNADGTIDATPAWTAYFPAAGSRNIYTDTYNTPAGCGAGTYSFDSGAVLNSSTAFDCVETAGLSTPAIPVPPSTDTFTNRIDYLRGDQTHEADGTYRVRTKLLGAIVNSQPVYVSYPSGNYYDTWPASSPEIGHSYDTFVADHAQRVGTVYIGANDGMLHAFNAPVPVCSSTPPCNYGTNPGQEDWAFIPRAVYGNLGNLTSRSDFSYRPTVDATPVTRDVFFSGDDDWHTILAGGVGLGGRGVYALDITGPSGAAAATPTTAPTKVLWELDSDMTIPNTCKSIVGTSQSGTCQASDLGYTVSQPNIGRLHTGQWAVLVPNGYFPDCSKPDYPTADFASCSAIAAQAPGNSAAKPTPYSALFVMDAETGTVLAELKTPTGLTVNGVTITSFGLATPVMGDYDNDQVDDVAFAGDLQGNLWRFDLQAASPTGWTVTLVYAGLADASGNQGLQPITTMPRLFPDPATNRFMVVFGTGKYLGAGDNSSNAVQSMMGVRDVSDTASPYSQTDLTRQYLHEETVASGPNAGATLRCVTGSASVDCAAAVASPTAPGSQVNTIPPPGSTGGGGWLINLYTTTSSNVQNNSGERVVVSPGAIFASNTVVFETLLAGAQGSDPCNPATLGAIMALNSVTGAPAGVSSLGGWPVVGGRISNARTSGSLPIVSALGGGQAYLPGTTLAPSGTKPLSIDAPIWRRRSWQGIQQN